MFDKFLGKKVPTQNIEEPPKPTGGRPRKPDHLLKYPRKDPSRYSPITGRLLPSKAKIKLKRPQWKRRRKKWREETRKSRAKRHLDYERRYNATLRRKYIQAKSIARLYAKKHQIDPDSWFPLTYAEWLILWATTPDVTHPERGVIKAAQAVGNPIQARWKNVTWASRRDETQPWSKENVVVKWNGTALPNKLSMQTPMQDRT